VPRIVAERKADRSGHDGWAREYRVLREDGDEVDVRVECSGTAAVVARHTPDLLRVVADEGRSVAIEQARLVKPRRGARVIVLCRAFGILTEVQYGRRLAA
jgi:hypothetical protein